MSAKRGLKIRQEDRVSQMFCWKCGYSLAGHEGEKITCPECGSTYKKKKLLDPNASIRAPKDYSNAFDWGTISIFVGTLFLMGTVFELYYFGRLEPAFVMAVPAYTFAVFCARKYLVHPGRRDGRWRHLANWWVITFLVGIVMTFIAFTGVRMIKGLTSFVAKWAS